jgi:hypothetical protein
MLVNVRSHVRLTGSVFSLCIPEDAQHRFRREEAPDTPLDRLIDPPADDVAP